MARSLILLVLLALCVVPSLAANGRGTVVPFLLTGSVYCDTCRCGYETSASHYLAGAVVRVECRDRKSSAVTFTKKAVTDSSGKYKVLVRRDCGDEVCDVVLIRSPDSECSERSPGRDQARVILTRNNGMHSNVRFANAMGFVKKTALDQCPQILQQYQEAEED